MSRRPSLPWILVRLALMAVGVLLAAAVIGWIARLIFGRRPRFMRSSERDPEISQRTQGCELGSEGILDVPFSEITPSEEAGAVAGSVSEPVADGEPIALKD